MRQCERSPGRSIIESILILLGKGKEPKWYNRCTRTSVPRIFALPTNVCHQRNGPGNLSLKPKAWKATWCRVHLSHSDKTLPLSHRSSWPCALCQSSHRISGWSCSCSHWAPWAHMLGTVCRSSCPPPPWWSRCSPRVSCTCWRGSGAPRICWWFLIIIGWSPLDTN